MILLASIPLLIGSGAADLLSLGSIRVVANPAKPIRISIAIKNRKLGSEAHKYIRITQGDVLELVFTTDETSELHLHEYDIYLNTEPGTPSVLRVDAKIAGRFALESHRFGSEAKAPSTGAHEHVVLLYLEVYPR
jgi:hypothetical protein